MSHAHRELRLFTDEELKFNADAKCIALSARHAGKSIYRVQLDRIMSAIYFLLFPLFVIVSYKLSGLTGMCWTLLVFFGFFAVYNYMYRELNLLQSLLHGSLLYCVLLSATLATENMVFLQSIPSFLGAAAAIMSGAMLLGIVEPQEESEIMRKQRNLREFKVLKYFILSAGLILFFVNEWVRRNMDIEGWVWFFALFRFEMAIAMMMIFTPVYVLVVMHQRDTQDAGSNGD